jgi:hypothetical protein
MNAVLKPALEITEERTFTARFNDRTVTGLNVESAWNGLTKYVHTDGDYLIVLDSEARIVTGAPALLDFLGVAAAAPVAQNPGEIYVGISRDSDGNPLHHVFLLAGDFEGQWYEAMKWAEKLGGDLPSRDEQRLLFEKVKPEFKPRWYWGSTQHAALSGFAWGQGFLNGLQLNNHKSLQGCARPIRRLPI